MLYQSSLHEGDIAGLVFLCVISLAIVLMALPAIRAWITTRVKPQAPIDYDAGIEDDEYFGGAAPLALLFMPIDWSGRYLWLAILIGLMAAAGYILLGIYLAKSWQRKWDEKHKRPKQQDE